MSFWSKMVPMTLILAILWVPGTVDAQTSHRVVVDAANIATCSDLKKRDFSTLDEAPSHILDTHWVALPEGHGSQCVVEAYVAPQVGFRLFLPQGNWNEKFVQMGSGGHAGFMSDEICSAAVAKGYACVISDLGHKGTGLDSDWARNNLPALRDWGYRATHVVTVSAKALILAFYGKGPKHSYFSGCSTGGRQALQEAQKFPWDYDGIIAGAPPIRLSDLYVTFAWSALANRDLSGHMLLDRVDLDLINKASLATCDLDDGIRDGLVARPQHCAFKPSTLACRPGQSSGCLSPDQIRAAEKIYSGPVDGAGHSIMGGGAWPGSERSWERYYLDDDQGNLPYIFTLTRNGLSDLFADPVRQKGWTIDQFDFAGDYRKLDVMQALYDSSNPDLTRFADAGGKIMMYMGLADISMPDAVLDYYEKVERVAGGPVEASKFARLYFLPGVDHCGGGPGADKVDFLSYLDEWVEKNTPPDVLVATHVANESQSGTSISRVMFSRPVYPYPAYAKYRGSGDPAKIESFERALPSR